MTLTLIDYGSGNIRSVAKALEAASDQAVRVTADPKDVAAARALVMPGQGAFGQCLAGLKGHEGLLEALHHAVLHHRVPYLGICVGMQLMCDRGLEDGVHEGFGWIGGEIGPLPLDDPGLKVPHMGWNTITCQTAHPVLDPVAGKDVYFCHSFAATKVQSPLAFTPYGGRQVAAIGRENMVGVQFHPEKSQSVGLSLLSAFAAWKP